MRTLGDIKDKAEEEKEHFDYLEELRDSGTTNMMGAGRYLAAEFALDKSTAKGILLKWMKIEEEENELF